MTAQQNSIDSPINCPQCGVSLKLTGARLDCPQCQARLILRTCQPDQIAGELLPFELPDPQAGLPVLNMCIPAAWDCTGGAQWTSNPAQAARVNFVIQHPHSAAALQSLPSDYFGWTSDPSMQNRISLGGNYYGTEFQPPATAMETLQRFLLPRYRPIPGLQIIGLEPVDALIQDISCNLKARGDTSMVDAFRVRLCYTLAQVPLFEQIEGVVLTSRKLSPGRYGAVEQVNWGTSAVYAYRARQDEFERWTPVFRRMIDSIQFNPHWQAFYQNTAQRLSQQAQLKVRQANDEPPTQQAPEAQELFLQSERLSSLPAEELRQSQVDGLKAAQSPAYQQVWSNGSGVYILSNDFSYNPNASGLAAWSQIDSYENIR